jgi:Mg/Co/Ni transporter MgtE
MTPEYIPPKKRRTGSGLILGAVLAAAAIVMIAYYGMGDRTRSAANPPAVMTSPAPATGIAAPAETTTGQSVPRPSGR